MTSEGSALARFHQFVIHRGGEDYYPACIGPPIVAACESSDVAVIGVEGFLFEDRYILPQMELIRDFDMMAPQSSWEVYRSTCNELALGFVDDLVSSAGLFLNFVTLARDQWQGIST